MSGPISLANFGEIGYTKWWQKARLSGSRAAAIFVDCVVSGRREGAIGRESLSTWTARAGPPRRVTVEARTQNDLVVGERE